MMLTCVRSRSGELPDHQRGRFVRIEEAYSVTVGDRYIGVGMGIWETVLHVLIRDDNGLPAWCPAALFDVEAQSVPTGWEFALDDGVTALGKDLWTRWIARWGYSELVRDPTHSDRLMDREPEAMEIFAREYQRREHDMRRVSLRRDGDERNDDG